MEATPVRTLARRCSLLTSAQGVPGGPLMKSSPESLRGFAASMLGRGADRICLFNHGSPPAFSRKVRRPDGTLATESTYRELLSQTATLESAIAAPRRHDLTFRNTVPPGVTTVTPLPAALKQGEPTTLRIHTGPRPEAGEAVIRAGLEEAPGLARAAL